MIGSILLLFQCNSKLLTSDCASTYDISTPRTVRVARGDLHRVGQAGGWAREGDPRRSGESEVVLMVPVRPEGGKASEMGRGNEATQRSGRNSR